MHKALNSVTRWLRRKWQPIDEGTLRAYAIFNTADGQRILQHWLDTVYCQVYEGSNQIELAHHNGRRSFVQEVLQNIQAMESPEAHKLTGEDAQAVETNGHGGV